MTYPLKYSYDIPIVYHAKVSIGWTCPWEIQNDFEIPNSNAQGQLQDFRNGGPGNC